MVILNFTWRNLQFPEHFLLQMAPLTGMKLLISLNMALLNRSVVNFNVHIYITGLNLHLQSCGYSTSYIYIYIYIYKDVYSFSLYLISFYIQYSQTQINKRSEMEKDASRWKICNIPLFRVSCGTCKRK